MAKRRAVDRVRRSRWCRPSLVLAWWTFFTEAGRLVSGATERLRVRIASLASAIADLPNWFIERVPRRHATRRRSSRSCCSSSPRWGSRWASAIAASPSRAATSLLPLACVVLYFVLPEGHGYIWLIAQRFPILFAMTAIPLLRMPTGGRGAVVTAAALALAVGATVNTCQHFIAFERDEVGDIDEAIDAMEPRQHVCALIYDKGSAIDEQRALPALRLVLPGGEGRGGEVHLRGLPALARRLSTGPATRRRGVPRACAGSGPPSKCPSSEMFPYYDYVLTRGSGFRPPPGTYHVKWQGPRWTVWARDS